ncbi:DUF4845 domain-containing protein [Uliginosibacterium sp. sgz301328]|uniref:DUF4845 domain-containing protein n=1 Tax=Uliginosibacterium sp. sgz301328 TaxID=3243764 RepID=UPI00359E35F6
MKRQKGLTLISTLIVGLVLLAALLLALKLVPVYNEFFSVKKAFNNVVRSVDVSSPPSAFRSAFQRYQEVDDIESVDPETIVVTKENGKAYLSVDYQRKVKLFGNVSLLFDFSVGSAGAPAAAD